MTFFDKMKDPLHELALSIQSIVSGMEVYKCSLFDKSYDSKYSADEPMSIDSLKAYIGLMDGMISGLSGPLK